LPLPMVTVFASVLLVRTTVAPLKVALAVERSSEDTVELPAVAPKVSPPASVWSAPNAKVPWPTVVVPVWALAPASFRVPAPNLLNPPVVAVLAPDSVRIASAVLTLSVLVVAAVRVKLRSVLAVAPV